ncbi:ATP-binding protein [uncultured Paracoccus sp.]|uniref:sensor histidine kinase n=1 Tax=uncultured Paracoccus sp. TaxID=189685 RepID=UPI0025E52C20|nr:ATP-binding protein [uncultured Paracoccus sp.]
MSRNRLALGALIALLAVPGGYAAHQAVTGLYFEQTAERAENTLGLAVSLLRGQLDRYRQLPELLAEQQNIQLFAGDPGNPLRLAAMNAYLKQTTELLGASDLYIMAPDGTTIAASNHDQPVSFIGENFAFRPYVKDALAGGRGSFFGLGTTSRKRGYYFSAPIVNDTGVAGVIALKVDVDAIENAWLASDYEIVVTDPEGIVFMSARPEWLFSGLRPLTQGRMARTQETRRYADAQLVELPLSLSVTRQGRQIMAMQSDSTRHEYLTVAEPMPDAGWTVKVFVDTRPARRQAAVTMAVILLAAGLTLAALMLWKQRRAQLAERLAHQHEVREKLEQRVAARTADLARMNLRLETEVAERRHTEDQLRKTQNDLVQAAKLAALGRMSAELSHEFNQPLAALRSYVDSAQVLIQRDRSADAARYLARIDGLADRMASISRNLSHFARQPGERLSGVPVAEAVTGALEILDWRIRADHVRIAQDLPPRPVHVRAGRTRLQQVLVNILSNAMDAMAEAGTDPRVITLAVRVRGQRVQIAIRDTGPGVPDAIMARIFDPFFSTKGIGRGLGLGLSICYNIVKDFGGDLTIRNGGSGGAEFSIWLDLHPAEPTPGKEPA